jgi:hypothetical protein
MKLGEAALQGTGIYTFSDAAKYARIHVNTLRSWFGNTGPNGPVLHREEIESADLKALSFNEFIEAVAIR